MFTIEDVQAILQIKDDSLTMLILVGQMEFYTISYIFSLKTGILSHYATPLICNLDNVSNNIFMNLF